jgi:hypothetical protein
MESGGWTEGAFHALGWARANDSSGRDDNSVAISAAVSSYISMTYVIYSLCARERI